MTRAAHWIPWLLLGAAALVAWDDADFFDVRDLIDAARVHHEQVFVVLVVLAAVGFVVMRRRGN